MPKVDRRSERRVRRTSLWVSGGAALGLAALMLIPWGFGGHVAPRSSWSITRPYPGTLYHYARSAADGCSGFHAPYPLNMNLTSGVMSVKQISRATICSPSPGGVPKTSTSFLFNQFDWVLPVNFSTSGAHTVTEKIWFSIGWNESINVSGGCHTTKTYYYWGHVSSGNCSAFSIGDLYDLTSVRDLTNGTEILGSEYYLVPPIWVANAQGGPTDNVSIYWGCYNHQYGGLCFSDNTSLRSTFTATINPGGFSIGQDHIYGTFNASHKYVIVDHFVSWVMTSVSGWQHASAYSLLNMADSGTGLKFLSWTVT